MLPSREYMHAEQNVPKLGSTPRGMVTAQRHRVVAISRGCGPQARVRASSIEQRAGFGTRRGGVESGATPWARAHSRGFCLIQVRRSSLRSRSCVAH
ncbi:hypothetical protein MTO96_018160 [Rhipicephalus appendiculatus]